MGHGGTLDPLATGVLILGVGSGTKVLGGFLECTKSYETVVLFGARTDSYDSLGKVVTRAPFEHVTREGVESALGRFRGQIMQRPPVFSALRVQGKRLYEYAREGKEVPVEIEERGVEVEELEVVEWLEGGTHRFRWPTEEVRKEQREAPDEAPEMNGDVDSVVKRKRDDDLVEIVPVDGITSKRARPTPTDETREHPINSESMTPPSAISATSLQPTTEPSTPCPAPAVRLRMTVTSGFYVRSLAHDLGLALNSAGLMASLVRTRQGDFELGKNVLEYEDLDKGEEVWGPKVAGMLEDWSAKHASADSLDGGREVARQRSWKGGVGKREKEKMEREEEKRRRNSSSEDG